MELKEIFAERLKQMRVEKGLSQYELAAKLKTSQANIARYEKGVTYPSMELLIAMADLFNMPLDYFFGRTGPYKERNPRLKGQLKEVLEEEMQPGKEIYELIKQTTDEIIADQLKKNKK